MGRFTFCGKRELLARGLFWCGVPLLLRRLPQRDSLMVLNHHRIGNPDEDLFDPGVFSATAGQLDEQISYVKRHFLPVTLEEAVAFVASETPSKTRRCRVLITFDDGYLDNYETAFPILRSHGVQGVFFLATSMVGSCQVPWWDHVAYLLRTAQRRRFTLRYPAPLEIDIDEHGLGNSLDQVLRLCKRSDNDPARFIGELREAAKGKDLPGTLRRFMNWDEAREMAAHGMAIGSHTHSHHVLSQLNREQQGAELSRSKAMLREQLGVDACALAYPVGSAESFSGETQRLAREAGYRAAFSFYGGVNLPGKTQPYDVKRISIGDQSRRRFEVQASICGFTGNYWP